MTKRAHCTLGVTLALTLAGSTGALAGPLHGKTYQGRTPSSGVKAEGHNRVALHAGGNIILRVSASGTSVTVRFSSSSPILYCRTQQVLHVQTTKPARISSSGAFRASVGQRFKAGPGAPALVQVITGRFSGGTVRGTIKTSGECGGVASFSATAR